MSEIEDYAEAGEDVELIPRWVEIVTGWAMLPVACVVMWWIGSLAVRGMLR